MDARIPPWIFFRNRILQIDEKERMILADIVIEARRCFDCRLDDPYLQNMPTKEPDAFGAQQMIRLYLEHFLIHMLRRYSNPMILPKLPFRPLPLKADQKEE